ncbi:Asp23/Gls24 family envelope stress response protein [Streptomyces sp. NPDC058612]|uniref:Asp23/Gls24 family envelope stress response protein n=1 Tax=Streptomyces sp. NPDC058612 TaxID=3346555 RepID=UPI003669C32F
MTKANSGGPSPSPAVIGEAVLGVRGVAFLRPALGARLRSAAAAAAATAAASPGRAASAPHHASGVKISAASGDRAAAVDVHVVLLRGYRALDVTRAVREAVRTSYPDAARTIPVHVVVTGIV